MRACRQYFNKTVNHERFYMRITSIRFSYRKYRSYLLNFRRLWSSGLRRRIFQVLILTCTRGIEPAPNNVILKQNILTLLQKLIIREHIDKPLMKAYTVNRFISDPLYLVQVYFRTINFHTFDPQHDNSSKK